MQYVKKKRISHYSTVEIDAKMFRFIARTQFIDHCIPRCNGDFQLTKTIKNKNMADNSSGLLCNSSSSNEYKCKYL